MAPASNNATMPSGSPFDGNNFYNNLFSDLSPLLALFGEQVTKQYMSQSIYWTGDVLLSILPLGIITILVSAIRVRGSESMRSLIGRAREPRADATLELLPSTSSEVSELWDGERIVRLKGKSEAQAFFLCQYKKDADTMTLEPVDRYDGDDGNFPSLMLNVPGTVRPYAERFFLVSLGLAIQIMVLYYAYLSSIQKHWSDIGNSTSTYPVSCFIVGTLVEAAGLLVCTYWIRNSASTETQEAGAWDRPIASYQAFILQPECQVSDHAFPRIAVLLPKTKPIFVARDNVQEFEIDPGWNSPGPWIPIGTFLSLAGFVAQFVGLRALHWSVAVLQLGATIFLTSLRTLERRKVANKPNVKNIQDNVGANGSVRLALLLSGLSGLAIPTNLYHLSFYSDFDITHLGPAVKRMTKPQNQHNGSTPSATSVIQLRRQLGTNLKDVLYSRNSSAEVCQKILAMANALFELSLKNNRPDGIDATPLTLQNTAVTQLSWEYKFLYHFVEIGKPVWSSFQVAIRRSDQQSPWKLETEDVDEILALFSLRVDEPLPVLDPNSILRSVMYHSPYAYTTRRIIGHASLYKAEALTAWTGIPTSTLGESLLKGLPPPYDEDEERWNTRDRTRKDLWGFEMIQYIREQVATQPQSSGDLRRAVETRALLDLSKALVCEDSTIIKNSDRQAISLAWIALEFYSVFFFHLSGQIASINGSTTCNTEADGKPRISNTTVDAVVSELANSELWKIISNDPEYILQQSRLIIIPALATRGLLKDIGPPEVRALWVPESAEVETAPCYYGMPAQNNEIGHENDYVPPRATTSSESRNVRPTTTPHPSSGEPTSPQKARQANTNTPSPTHSESPVERQPSTLRPS